EFEEFDSPVTQEKLEATVAQPNDADFKRDVQNLINMGGDDPGPILGAVSAQIKRDVRQQLLDRLEQRLNFYLRNGRTADRIAAANLVSDTMGSARRQDNQELPGAGGERRTAAPNSFYLRQAMRKLAGDLQKLTVDGDTQVQVATVRALSNLE